MGLPLAWSRVSQRLAALCPAWRPAVTNDGSAEEARTCIVLVARQEVEFSGHSTTGAIRELCSFDWRYLMGPVPTLQEGRR